MAGVSHELSALDATLRLDDLAGAAQVDLSALLSDQSFSVSAEVNGLQPLLGAERHTVRFGGKTFARRPVILRKDALRPGAPLQDIRLSPKTKLLADDWINEPDLNAPGTYVTGAQLIEQDRVERDLYCKSVTYFALKFAASQVVECDGLLARIPQNMALSQAA